MAQNKRNWNFRGGDLPDEKNLVFKNVTTKKIERFIKDRIIKASGGKLNEKSLEDMHIISVDIGENFIPFFMQIPMSLRVKKQAPRDNENGKADPWFNTDDDDNKPMVNASVYAVISAYFFNKADVNYFTDFKGRKAARILNGMDAQFFAVYSKPRLSPDKESILVFLDPAAVFGDYLVDLDNPKQRFVPNVDVSRSTKISDSEWSFTIVRKVLKSKKGISIGESIDNLRHPKMDDR